MRLIFLSSYLIFSFHINQLKVLQAAALQIGSERPSHLEKTILSRRRLLLIQAYERWPCRTAITSGQKERCLILPVMKSRSLSHSHIISPWTATNERVYHIGDNAQRLSGACKDLSEQGWKQTGKAIGFPAKVTLHNETVSSSIMMIAIWHLKEVW